MEIFNNVVTWAQGAISFSQNPVQFFILVGSAGLIIFMGMSPFLGLVTRIIVEFIKLIILIFMYLDNQIVDKLIFIPPLKTFFADKLDKTIDGIIKSLDEAITKLKKLKVDISD